MLDDELIERRGRGAEYAGIRIAEVEDQIDGARNRNGADRALAKKRDPRDAGFTADTPVPYRVEDLINLLDEQMGKLENRSSRMIYHKLISRIQTIRNHPRYAFMFENANIGGDTMADILCQLFRLPPQGKPMTIMQLAGFPAEVVDSTARSVSVRPAARCRALPKKAANMACSSAW